MTCGVIIETCDWYAYSFHSGRNFAVACTVWMGGDREAAGWSDEEKNLSPGASIRAKRRRARQRVDAGMVASTSESHGLESQVATGLKCSSRPQVYADELYVADCGGMSDLIPPTEQIHVL